jgi:glycosyltransferase involved in cell wall biosynthesis
MKFSIITPVFNGMPWIDCCIRSVRDQQQVDLEHIIQDGGSSDGTAQLCQQFPLVQYVQEKDRGMYDAINRGFKRAQGDIFLQLNCDEQLLPGALSAASRFFETHPEVEIAFAYVLVLNPEGNLLCYRKTLLPTLLHTQISHLATLTCATFYRRQAIEKHGLYFDTDYRVLGDAELICRALNRKVRMAIFPEYTSAFTITGKNLSNDTRAIPERQKMAAKAPWLLRKAKPLVKMYHRIARKLGGVYSQGPLDYSVYTPASLQNRISFHVEKPDFRWKDL